MGKTSTESSTWSVWNTSLTGYTNGNTNSNSNNNKTRNSGVRKNNNKSPNHSEDSDRDREASDSMSSRSGSESDSSHDGGRGGRDRDWDRERDRERERGRDRGKEKDRGKDKKRRRSRSRSKDQSIGDLIRERTQLIAKKIKTWAANAKVNAQPLAAFALNHIPKSSQGWAAIVLITCFILYIANLWLVMQGEPRARSSIASTTSSTSTTSTTSSLSTSATMNIVIPSTPEKPDIPKDYTATDMNLTSGELSLSGFSHPSMSSPANLDNFKKMLEETEPGFLYFPKFDLLPQSDREQAMALMTTKHPFSRKREDLMVPPDVKAYTTQDVANAYRTLAKAYLAPFSSGIRRAHFFEILKRRTYSLTPPGANKGIQSILFQIENKKVYMLDPYEITKSKNFYKTRVNELVWILSKLASENRLPRVEFLAVVHDCIQTAHKEHKYRGPTYLESLPAFTIVTCNFSDNIPFPMWEGDDDRGGGYLAWNSKMKEYSVDPYPWKEKKPIAVFRGGLRPSMYFETKKEANLRCEEAGRSRLEFLSRAFPSLFDVSVSGQCRDKSYSLKHMEPREHHQYKYIAYMEGNCFWADRINRQLFGPSAVLKQETPCGQFFEPLLRPHAHYIPTDFFLSDTVLALEWAKSHDAHVMRIVENANAFASKFLSLEGIEIYVEEVLKEYAGMLLNKEFLIEAGAVDVTNQKF